MKKPPIRKKKSELIDSLWGEPYPWGFSTAQKTQDAFRQAIAKYYPEVLSMLSREILPIYLKACPSYSFDPGDYRSRGLHLHLLDTWKLKQIIKNKGLNSTEKELNYLTGDKRRAVEGELTPTEKARIGLGISTLSELRVIDQLLSKWRYDFNLLDTWCTDNALVTMWWWHIEPKNIGKWCPLVNLLDSETRYKGMTESFEFQFLPWHVNLNTWASYKGKIEEAFAKRLNAYRQSVLAEAMENDTPIAKETYAETHYKWLADFQVGRMNYSEIARNANPTNGGADRKTVREAIKNLASIINLTLRSTTSKI